MLRKILRAARAVIERIEKDPNVPAGVYFGTFMVYWAVSALSETHLVDAELLLLPHVPALSNVTFSTLCQGVLYVVVAVGAVAVAVVPVAMLCARKFRVALKALLVGCGAVAASIAFSFLTSTLLFVISIEVDHWHDDAASSAERNFWSDRQPDGEGGAFALLRRAVDGAVVEGCDRLCEGEPEPEARL